MDVTVSMNPATDFSELYVARIYSGEKVSALEIV